MNRFNGLLVGVSSIALFASGVLTPADAQTSIALDPITIVATKTPETTTQALAAVSSIRQEQIKQFMPSKMSTIFSSMPGVWFQERGDDQGSAINIRGLQDFGRVAVLIDGARQNFQRTGHNADGLFYFEPELLAAADVARGPVANIYGSGAIGGVVSMRTKDVDDILAPGQRAGVLTHGEVGTNTSRGLGSAFAAARLTPNVDAMIGGTWRKNKDYDDGSGIAVLNSGFETHTGIGKLTMRPALGHEIKLGGTFYETEFKNGTPNATRTATVYATRVENDIASARYKYSRPEDRIFDFDGNVYLDPDRHQAGQGRGYQQRHQRPAWQRANLRDRDDRHGHQQHQPFRHRAAAPCRDLWRRLVPRPRQRHGSKRHRRPVHAER